MTESLLDNLTVRAKDIIAEASDLAKEAGTENLSIMAVTKNQPEEMIELIRLAGVSLFGENRVQHYLQKRPYFESVVAQVHLIGHLQSNKVTHAVGSFHMIQSVDSVRLAKIIGQAAEKKGIYQDILLEVNAGRDPGKFGFSEEQIFDVVYEIGEIQNIRIKGLMTVPPICDPDETSVVFQTMQKLFIDIKRKKIDNVFMEILSMGMSGDYKLAIKEGANMIRLGSVLFNC